MGVHATRIALGSAEVRGVESSRFFVPNFERTMHRSTSCHRAQRARAVGASAGLLFMALTGCKSATPFSGETVIGLAQPKPPPPPPAPPPEPPPPPPEAPKRVEVKADRIVINEKIQFEVNKATIRPESDSLLDEIAKTIKEHAEIKKVRVEGHASKDGSAALNLTLSDNRAKAVVAALVKRGVAGGVLEPKGFGDKQPIADNDTPEGREKNRRVEFVIVEQAPKTGEAPIAAGAPAAAPKKAEAPAAAGAAPDSGAKASTPPKTDGDAKAPAKAKEGQK